MYFILLIAICIICVYTAVAGAKQYKIFSSYKKTADRIRMYRRWIVESWLYFGLFSVIALLLVNQTDNLFHPIVQSGLNQAIPASIKEDSESMKGFLVGFVIGLSILMISVIVRSRRSLKKRIATVGEFEALVPRNKQERKYGAAIAVTAGVTEELFFRAAMPVVLLGVLHNAQLAIAISVITFGFMHIYQGWKGVIVTGLMGFIMMKVFIIDGNIFVPMAIHAFIDLNSLVLMPLLAERSAKNTTKLKAN